MAVAHLPASPAIPSALAAPAPPALRTTDVELPRLVASPVAPETARGRRVALTVLLIVSFLVVAWVASSLWVGILLGTVMAFTAQPMYRALSARLGNRKRLAASLTVVVYGLGLLGVGALTLYVISAELLAVATVLEHKLASGRLVDLIGEGGIRTLQRVHVNESMVAARLQQQVGQVASYAAAGAAVVVQATTSALVGLILALFSMFYVLLEWANLALRLERILPLDPRHTRALIIEFREVGRTAFVGTVATAAIQGALAGFGYALVGVPHPVTWAVATALASFLPVLGTGLAWGGVGVFLLADGRPGAAIFVLAWGLLVVMTATDYVIRPRLVGSKGLAHPLLLLVALFGGVKVMGLPGLIVAPILMSLFLAVLRIYEREVGTEGGPPPPTSAPTGDTRG